ncbi:MAG: protein kinase [Fuerstiella sp.]
MRSDGVVPDGLIEQAERLDQQLHQDQPGDVRSGDLPEHICSAIRLLNRAFGSTSGGLEQSRPPATDASVSLPKTIGRFEIRERVGMGSFGVVYRAWDPVLKRDVALKVPRIHTTLVDELLGRFLREAEAAARLHHPNLVPVYEAGFEGSVAFICAEFCHGPTLATWLKEQGEPVPPRTAAKMLLGVADGLDHAHRHGILHRDLKPGNILLDYARPPQTAIGNTAPAESGSASEPGAHDQQSGEPRPGDDGRQPVPRVTDFGLARFVHSAESTLNGTILGTIGYMAPEQAAADGSRMSAATDVYALGVILYELLTKQRPINAESYLEHIRRVHEQVPVAPEKLRREIPRDLSQICLKCLRKEPANRYSTAAALRDDLQRYLDGQPTVARPVSAAERLIRWARRSPAVAGLVLISVTALMLLVAQTLRHNQQLSESVRRLSALSREAREASERAFRERQRAVTSEQQALALAYASNLRLAAESFRADNVTEARRCLEQCQPASGRLDQRGFEWYLLHSRLKADQSSWQAHHEAVYSSALRPDGRLLAVGSADHTVRLWDLSSRTSRRVLSGHSDEVNKVRYSADASLIATASDDCTARIYDAETGSLVGRIEAHASPVHGLDFIRNSHHVVTGSYDGLLCVSSSAGDRLAAVDLKHPIEDLDVSPDGRFVAVATGKRVSLRSLPDLARHPLPAAEFERNATNVRFSADGRFLAATIRGPHIHIWDFAKRNRVAVLRGHKSIVHGIEFRQDRPQLVSTGRDGTARLWDLTTAISPRVYSRESMSSGPALSLATHNIVLIPASDEHLDVWNGTRAERIQRVRIAAPPSDTVNGCLQLAATDDQNLLFVRGGRSGPLQSFHVTTDGLSPMQQPEISLRKTHSDSILCPSAGGHVMDMRADGFYLWQAVGTWRHVEAFVDVGSLVACDYNAAAGLVAAVRTDGTVNVWSSENGTLHRQITHLGHGRSLCFLEHGNALAIGDAMGTIHVVNANSGRVLASLRMADVDGKTHAVTSLKCSPGGKLLAGAVHGSVCVVSSKSLQPVHSMAVSEDVSEVSWQDEQHLLAAGEGGLVSWKLPEQPSTRRVLNTNNRLWSVQVTSDGNQLIATDGGGRIHLAALDTHADTNPRVLGTACRQLTGARHSDDLSVIAVADHSGEIHVLKTADSFLRHEPRKTMEVSAGRVPLAVTPAGDRIFVEDRGNGILCSDGKADPRLLVSAETAVREIAVSHSGRLLAAAWRTSTGGVSLFDATTGDMLQTVESATYGSLVFGRRSGQVYFLRSANVIAAADAATQRTVATIELPGSCTGFVLSDDERLMAVFQDGTGGNFLSLWDLDQQRHLSTLVGHDDRVVAAEFCPANRTLASVSEDGTLRLWHVESGQPLDTLHRQPDPLLFVAFSRDGCTLAAGPVAGPNEQTMRFWTIKGQNNRSTAGLPVR